MKQKQLLFLLALLMTAATGAWAQSAKHVITATYDKQTRLLEQPLPYVTTLGALFEAAMGQSYSYIISRMASTGMPLTGISSDNTDVVSIGEPNGALTPVTVNADGKATIILNFSGYVQGIYVNVVPPLYVTMADGTEDAGKWTATVGTSSTAKTLPVGELSKGNAVTLTYGGHLKVKSVTATTDAAPGPLATPLTIEAVTAGTITVNMSDELETGMKYSVNGGDKVTITTTTGITVAKGDKVQFYGNGTQIQAYGDNTRVRILGIGEGFQTKVYGNIMSLLDETDYATKTELPNVSRVFSGLFRENATLIDASELLLPATELTPYCYSAMFEDCTSLTKAPKLPATTLAMLCYYYMFYRCTSLTSAYVKAAYTEVMYPCRNMFDVNTETGAVLHTTSDNKASWEDVMGTDKEWETWTVADDWQD